MIFDRVTFTGADDSVRGEQLAELSREFPFVEWGILFAPVSYGGPRFPSLDWLRRELPKLEGTQLSAHLCGGWVRDLVAGRFLWPVEGAAGLARMFSRVQVNFHGTPSPLGPKFLDVVRAELEWSFILQCDGVNDSQIRAYAMDGLAHPLFDASSGAGAVPRSWPAAWPDVFCGYAGGLGPDNIAAELARIVDAAGTGRVWVDMETCVRSHSDRVFDLGAVRSVLDQLAPWVGIRID